MNGERTATLERTTKETSVQVTLCLDGQGEYDVSTDVPFFDHMLSHIAKHGLIDMTIKASGDTDVDFHHIVEDVGLVLGDALGEALGDKSAIVRYGWASVPMDEALVMAAVDLSGRPHLRYALEVPREKIGNFDTELGEVFFSAVVSHLKAAVHLVQLSGGNSHHILEAAFKAFGLVIRQAVAADPRREGVPSTKGTL
ncbi:MAG: imidazoleglycerol-phosphate dehydratase HisB [Armatimonadota bacterium]|jgi:imidazoleglycerol-phosphate dehydratase